MIVICHKENNNIVFSIHMCIYILICHNPHYTTMIFHRIFHNTPVIPPLSHHLVSSIPMFYPIFQWEFQDPKMEVLYHMSGHILWGYSLT